MAVRAEILAQNLIGGKHVSTPPVSTEIFASGSLDTSNLVVFNQAQPLGLSPYYDSQGGLAALAICDGRHCLIIDFKRKSKLRLSRERKLAILEELRKNVFQRDAGDIFAFDFGPLAMSLYTVLDIHVINAVDIQSISSLNRDPRAIVKALLGDSVPFNSDRIEVAFRNYIYNRDERNWFIHLFERAWLSQFLPTLDDCREMFDKVPRIDTCRFNDNIRLLNVIAKLSIDALRLDLQKPTEASHEVALVPDVHSKDHQLKSQNFRNRVRRNKHVHIAVTNETGDYRVHGTVGSTFKQLTQLQVERGLEGVTVTKVITTGRTDSTHAEAQRAAFVLRLLQGSQELGPWVQNVWLPADDGLISWPEEWLESVTPPLTPSPSEIDQSQLQTLNASQQEAVNTMLSTNSDHHITIIQGPPGTGKTSVIASYVQFSISSGRTGIWLVAQSNVAVKNIAEKLIKVGFFNWRLLVSQEYYDGWHEHQYDKVQKHKNLIGSSSFKHAKKQLQGVPVILCTLDMLANPHILSVFTPVVPINSLVVDEASQIEIGNYLIPFSTFQGTLRKVCFIGDDKQLPPFGQEEFEDIQSIFEVEHLNKKVIFLDTQYRMPPQIGRFISAAVYDSKLESNPLHPVKDTKIACKFINVVGKERNHQDSYQNLAECQAVVKLALKLQDLQASYRIISPYNGQIKLIEDKMKAEEGLHWGDKCFSVDSFQGNEDDFIVISLVRSLNIGFMKNLRRTNVMLTRCKRGMFIVSSHRFLLTDPGASTLVGEMAKHMGIHAWLDESQIETADLLV